MQASLLRPHNAPRHRRPTQDDGPSKRRSGFTLVEMLVAMALTLIMVYAIAEFYAYIGDSVRDGRAMIEMGGQLRAASQRLKRDLDSLTVRVVPWTDDGNNSGYFEYYEGRGSDLSVFTHDGDSDGTVDHLQKNGTTLLGDGDDILAFTITSGAEPFQGRYTSGTGGVTASRQAEVIWWTGFNDLNGNNVFDVDEPRFLFRRQLLILSNPGQIGSAHTSLSAAQTALADFWQNNDVSASIRSNGAGQYTLQANTLSDLTRREHRFAHRLDEGFPYGFDLHYQAATIDPKYILTTLRGEDVMLSNLLSFDVRAYDPSAQLVGDTSAAADATLSLAPGDVNYVASASNATLGYGAYVDLYYNSYGNSGKTSAFSGDAVAKSRLGSLPARATNPLQFTYGATYDTWSLNYERSQPGNGVAMNGIDDNNSNGVDDPDERVTSPPYAVPLRGIQVKIRIYDPSSRQVRQTTVVADFVDE